MALTPKLDLRSSQQLVLTPQLQQAIKLLQLTNIELADYIETQLHENPLLERNEETISSDNMDVGEERNDHYDDNVEYDENYDSLAALGNSDSEEYHGLDTQYDNDFDMDYAGAGAEIAFEQSSSYNASNHSFDDDDSNLLENYSEQENLRDYLIKQMRLDINDEQERFIALILIDHLDASGWLNISCEELAENLNIDIDIIIKTLKKLQNLEPAGIFARDLRECLVLQLEDQNRYDEKMKILCDNLILLGDGQYKKLMQMMKCDRDELKRLVTHLQSLNPKPAAHYDLPMADPIHPDVFVRQAKNPETKQMAWEVALNEDALPRILVNSQFYSSISKSIKEKTQREYISERYQHASWLVRSLEQRTRTILKISQEIVRQQEGFFLYGISHLRPLVLRDIAEAVEMHESTISRATSNKYMATPRGLFELKYFFSSSLSTTGGGDSTLSSQAVRHRIKSMIDKEPPNKILSDDKIVLMLRDEGVDIARRTVAKYREAMNIPSSPQRRRMKRPSL